MTYKSNITKSNIVKYGLPKDWSITEFTFRNPSNSLCVHDLFKQDNLVNMSVTPALSLTETPLNFDVIPYANITSAITFSTIQDKLYLANTFGAPNNNISVINPITLVVEATISMPSDIKKMAYSPVDNRVFAISSSSQNYYVIDCETNVLTNIVPALSGIGECITYNSIKNSFYITDFNNNLYEIDSTTALQVFSTFIGNGAINLTFVSSKNDMYIALNGISSVLDWDCTTNTAVGAPIAATISGAIAIQYCSDKNTVYIGSPFGIREIDVITNTLLATNINTQVHDFGYHAPSNRMYVVYRKFYSIIDCGTNTLLPNTFPTGFSPSSSPRVPLFAVDPNNNRVFSSSDGFTPSNSHAYFVWETDDCYVTGSDDYNEWVRSTFNDPMLVRRIEYLSQNTINFNQVLNKTHKDANGNEVHIPLIPELSVCMTTFQNGIAQMEFEEGHLTFGKGGDYFADFTVQPLSEIKFLIYYKQTDAGALLSDKGRESIFGDLNFPHNEPKSWSEKELTSGVYCAETSIIPFDMSMINPEQRSTIKKIISKPLKEEVIEFETKVYVGQSIIENPEDIEFQVVAPKFYTTKHKEPKLEYEDIHYVTKVYGGEAIIEDASRTEFEVVNKRYTPTRHKEPKLEYEDIEYVEKVYGGGVIIEDTSKSEYEVVKSRYVPTKHKTSKLEYEDIEYVEDLYAGQTIVPYGSDIEYEQVETGGAYLKHKEEELYYEDIEIDSKVYANELIIQDINKVIITVDADDKSDELIAKLKASNKRGFSQIDISNY